MRSGRAGCQRGPSPRAWGEPAGSLARSSVGPSPRAWGERASDRALPQRRTIPTRVGRTEHWRVAGPCRTDHPHARGENAADGRRGRRGADHPHARGENATLRPGTTRQRTIPTRVGRTQATRSGDQVSEPDHPHARGENPAVRLSMAASSRTIPTRVGRTWTRPAGARGSTDHPHARGENVPMRMAVPRAASDHPHARGERHAPEHLTDSRMPGPSPRAWGEHRRESPGADASDRTIPTRVGRTTARDRSASMCRYTRTIPTRVGRTWPGTRRHDLGHGPSPRAWGERPASEVRQPTRTIPTRVGRTSSSCRRSSGADHPHARGENSWLISRITCQPRTIPTRWGERASCDAVPSAGRTIPTRVGRTRGRRGLRCHVTGPSPRAWGERPAPAWMAIECRADHPHARGENACDRRSPRRPGPSPRAWGERSLRQAPRAELGPSPRAWGERPVAIG